MDSACPGFAPVSADFGGMSAGLPRRAPYSPGAPGGGLRRRKRVHCPALTRRGRGSNGLAAGVWGDPPRRRARGGSRGCRRLPLLAGHAGLLRLGEVAGPFGGSPRLARRLRRAAHLRRFARRRRARARLPARERAALPDGDPAPHRTRSPGRGVWRRSARGRQVPPHPWPLPRRRKQLRRAFALGAKAVRGLCRRRQRFPRQPQERAAARVPHRPRRARAVEAGQLPGLEQADGARALAQLRDRGAARPPP